MEDRAWHFLVVSSLMRPVNIVCEFKENADSRLWNKVNEGDIFQQGRHFFHLHLFLSLRELVLIASTIRVSASQGLQSQSCEHKVRGYLKFVVFLSA